MPTYSLYNTYASLTFAGTLYNGSFILNNNLVYCVL